MVKNREEFDIPIDQEAEERGVTKAQVRMERIEKQKKERRTKIAKDREDKREAEGRTDDKRGKTAASLEIYKTSPIANPDILQGEGTNTLYTAKNLELMSLPDIDFADEQAVLDRLGEYFTICAKYDSKPTVSGLALSLNGKDRVWLHRLLRGENKDKRLSENSRNAIIKAYNIMGVNWEDYMLNGKINPAAGIFLGKNNFGYRNMTENIITPNVDEERLSPDDIRKRYLDEEKD